MKHAITLLIAMFGALSVLSSQNSFFNHLIDFQSTLAPGLNDWATPPHFEDANDERFCQDRHSIQFLLKNNFQNLPKQVLPFQHFSAIGISTYAGIATGTSIRTSKEDLSGISDASRGIATEKFMASAFAKPANGFIPIRVNSLDEESKLQIFKVNGDLVYETKLQALETSLDINQLDYGYYIVSYSSKADAWRLPLIKH